MKLKTLSNFLIPNSLFYDRFNCNYLYGRREWSKISRLKHLDYQRSALGIVTFSLVIQMLLICAGIHPHPGPDVTDDHRAITICHSNIRSVKQIDKHGIKEKMMHIKCNFVGKFKIITISETWLSRSDSSNDFMISGYQGPFRRDREENVGALGYGGVLAWVKSNIVCKRRGDLEIPGIEAMWLEIRSQNKKFFLCVIYRAPTCSAEFWDLLQTNVNMVQEIDGCRIVITGDLNADPGTPAGNQLKLFCEANSLTTHIKEPTRITPHSQKILDQFITNVPLMVKSVSVSPPVSSNDHCTIAMELNFRIPNSQSYTRIMWDFKNANFGIFRDAISCYNWQELINNANNIDAATEAWTVQLLKIAKETIPYKLATVRPKDKPWYTNALRQLCRKKDRLFKQAKQVNSPQHWERYRRIRNKYFNDIADAKAAYDNNKYQILADKNTSPKKWWSLIKQVNKSNDVFESIPPLDTDGEILVDDKAKANAFNLFFQKASLIDDSTSEIPNEVLFFEHALQGIDITLQDVIDQIRALDTTKSYGPDLISPVFLKEGGLPLAQSLCQLYNLSLRLSTVPKQWKMANVVPIHKKDEKDDIKNYRPVSLLSVVGKIMERIVFKYTYNFFKDNFIISDNQSGFLPGHSTVTQLLEVYHEFC